MTDDPKSPPDANSDARQQPLVPPPSDSIGILCPDCDYDLTGATGARCTWCGSVLDVETLASSPTGVHSLRRVGLIVTATVTGWGTFLALFALVSRQPRLSLLDGIAVFAAGVAGIGHCALAVHVFRARRRRFPLRLTEMGRAIRAAAIASVVTGIVGAVPALDFAPTRLVVRGNQVNGPAEFIAAVILFTLPGVTLLILYVVAFDAGLSPVRSAARGGARAKGLAPFEVGVFNSYRRQDVICTWTDEPRPTTQLIDNWIDHTWEAEVALAQEFDRTLFNGALARLVRFEVHDSALVLRCGPTCYRDFLGTNVHNATRVAAVNPYALSNALGVSALIAASDGWLALGRRSDRVATMPGWLHAFGGMVDATTEGGAVRIDAFAAVLREIDEELGVSHDEVDDIRVIGLVFDREIRQPELLFRADVRLTRDELAARFNPERSHGEHSAIEFFSGRPDEQLPWLESVSRIAPVAEAAVLLNGRRQWGDAWYERACVLRFACAPPVRPAS